MPWVAAFINLLAEPLLTYCLAVRDLALQAGLLQPQVVPVKSLMPAVAAAAAAVVMDSQGT